MNRGTKRGFPGEYKDYGSYDENRLPHGWLDCPAYGEEIGCFIPSKVPLDESYNRYISSGKTYTPKQLIHEQRLLGRELGLVIDLTNTTRYYPRSDWTKEGINHVKIRCKGRDEVPDNASIQTFIDEVLLFCSQPSCSKKYILVHCTHGHNRTGFMIVHFLVHNKSISVSEAIDKFSRARPPGIYKDDYIDALYMFYHETKPEGVGGLQTPEWKKSYFDLNSEAVPNQADERISSTHDDHASIDVNVITHDDVLGDAIRFNQQKTLQQVCYQLLKLDAGPRVNFPGSHPVSLNRDNLQLLRQRYYYATWKADGTRYMMLITTDGCYLIDRKFNFRKVLMRFPYKLTKEGIAENTHHHTLLDGEMIIDTDSSTGKQERRYLIYDLIAINQESVVELPFYQRWALIEKEVVQPRKAEMSSKMIHLYYSYDLESFTVRRKGFWLLSTVTKLLKNFIPSLSHESDGLILQGWDDPYVPRTHEGLLKWKFPEMNSVDFLFEMGNDNHPQLFLFERGRKKFLGGNRVKFEDGSDPYFYSGKIIECSWDSEENTWICMRIRTDKSTPNEFNTYHKVMRSIRDNITQDDLLIKIDETISLPMYADRTQYDIRAHQRARRK